jgi:hypothetical protein
VIFNVNFNILKQFKCALVEQIKDLMKQTSYLCYSYNVSVNWKKLYKRF